MSKIKSHHHPTPVLNNAKNPPAKARVTPKGKSSGVHRGENKTDVEGEVQEAKEPQGPSQEVLDLVNEHVGAELAHEKSHKEEEAQDSKELGEKESPEKAPAKGEHGSDTQKAPKLSMTEKIRIKREQMKALKETKDGYERKKAEVARKEPTKHVQALDLPRGARTEAKASSETAMHVLNNAQGKGEYFKITDEGASFNSQTPEENEQLEELLAAVEEAKQVLADVPGITRIAPGENNLRQPVVLILTARGFGEASLKVIPEVFFQFKTLVAVPWDLLPLRRDRSQLGA